MKQTEVKTIRKLAAIMFIDIVGFSHMMGKDEDQTLLLLQDFEKIVSPIIFSNNGIIIKKLGDGLFCEFSSALFAVDCALKIHEVLNSYNKDQDDNFNLVTRIGIHLGDVVKKKNDLFGDGVNIAARIEPLAPHGGICISEAIYFVIRNHPKFEIISLGKKELKNIDHLLHLYLIKTGYEVESDLSKKIDDSEQNQIELTKPIGNLKKNKIIIINVFIILFIIAIIIIYKFYDFELMSSKQNKTELSSQDPSNVETLPATLREQINSKTAQNFISQIQQLKSFKELAIHLQNSESQGKLFFGKQSDFKSSDNKFVIIVDEQNIYTILFFYDSKYFDIISNKPFIDLSEKFKGKRSIWVELL